MTLDLVKMTELFLVPSSFLVAALGTADTYPHKAAVSALGLVVSILWLWCSREALAEAVLNEPQVSRTARVRILGWFPLIFVVGWFVSVVAHLTLLRQLIGIV